MAREFVCLFEQNSYRNELYVFYLQWTGNEKALKLLNEAITRSEFDELKEGHISASMDLNTKLTESVVDLHCKVNGPTGWHRMFTKCTGTFECPFSQKEIDSLDGYDIAWMYNEKFYSNIIKEYFSDYSCKY